MELFLTDETGPLRLTNNGDSSHTIAVGESRVIASNEQLKALKELLAKADLD